MAAMKVVKTLLGGKPLGEHACVAYINDGLRKGNDGYRRDETGELVEQRRT